MEDLHRRAGSRRFWRARTDGFGDMLFNFVLQPLGSTTYVLQSFCKKFPKIEIFILRPCSRSGKIFKSLTRLVCELLIISINNFAKGNIFMLTITSQQLFFTIENLKILYATVIDADNAIFKAYSL